MEIKKIIIAFSFAALSCSNNVMHSSHRRSISSNQEDSYFKFIPKGYNSYTVEWGNVSYKNETTNIFDNTNTTLKLLEKGKDAIVLVQGCGTSCNYYVVLPLKKGKPEKVFLSAIALDIQKNLVAYIPEDDKFVVIENYLTGEQMKILEKNLCPAAFKGDCINSSYFEGNLFKIKWQGAKWNSKKPDLQEQTIVLKF